MLYTTNKIFGCDSMTKNKKQKSNGDGYLYGHLLYIQARFFPTNMHGLLNLQRKCTVGTVNNFKTFVITNLLTILRLLQMHKNMRGFVSKMLFNSLIQVPGGFTNIPGITARA